MNAVGYEPALAVLSTRLVVVAADDQYRGPFAGGARRGRQQQRRAHRLEARILDQLAGGTEIGRTRLGGPEAVASDVHDPAAESITAAKAQLRQPIRQE